MPSPLPKMPGMRGMATLVKAHFLRRNTPSPHMRASGGGSIVNISSVHGLLMAPRKLIYEAGKSAVIGVTKQMAIDFGPDGIRSQRQSAPATSSPSGQQERWDENPGGLRYFEDQYPVRRTGLAARHRQRSLIPQFRRGVLHHGPRARRRWRPHHPASGGLQRAAGPLHPRPPRRPHAVLG